MERASRLDYTRQFYEDISETIAYIVNVLRNPLAAQRLKDDAESAILKRMDAPTAFEPYYTDPTTGDVYYPIYIREFIVFYVMVGDVMEIRRFVYGHRNMRRVLS